MTARTYYAEQLTTAEMTAGTFRSQKFRVNRNVMLLAVRAWLIFHNSGFTAIRAKIYSDSAGSPGSLLYTSSDRKKSALQALAYAAKDVYFEFNPDDGYALGSGYYHLCLEADGYTADDDHHIAWRKDWPEPVYPGFAATGLNLSSAPFALTLVDAPLLCGGENS